MKLQMSADQDMLRPWRGDTLMKIKEFAAKLALVLGSLSMSGGRMAAEMAVDKSVISRWLNGRAQPSPHNLDSLSAVVARRVPGFRSIDWDRDLSGLATRLGVDPAVVAAAEARGLPLPTWDHLIESSRARGGAYEGFFRSTRPNPVQPYGYVHEHGMIRRDEIGLLRLNMGSADSLVEGWMLPINGQLFSIAVDLRSGSLLFGLFHGVGASRVEVFDGLTLIPGADRGRSPTATPMICERVGDLSGDREADDRRFSELAAMSPVGSEQSVPDRIRAHLARDFGPLAHAAGGEWLLSMTLAMTLSRGPRYEPDAPIRAPPPP